MNRVITDAGPLVALFDPSDAHHRWAVAHFREVPAQVFTCDAAMTEAAHLLRKARKGLDGLLGAWKRNALITCFNSDENKSEIVRLMHQYRDVPMSLADASLVRMCELMPDATLLTVDDDFTVYRRFGRRVIPLIAPWQT